MSFAKALSSIKVPVFVSLFAASNIAGAAMVSFDDVNDAFAGGFSSAASVDDGMGTFEIGFDPTFIASSVAGGSDHAFDTISLNINAAPGQKITKVTYIETVDIDIADAMDGGLLGIVSASITANGDANSLGSSTYLAGTDVSIDLTTSYEYDTVTEAVAIVITNSLTSVGLGSVDKSAARLIVETAPIPLPAPVLLFATAIGAVLLVRRRS